MNTNQKSMLEVAIELMGNKKTPQNARTFIKEVLELSGLDDESGDLAAQLYSDITESATFVYCGEGTWDLKSRQSLDLYDKDGSHFSNGEYEDDEDDIVTADDYATDEEIDTEDDEDYGTMIVEDDEDVDNNLGIKKEYLHEINEEDDLRGNADWQEDDEDEYNEYMDDYEDLYDE